MYVGRSVMMGTYVMKQRQNEMISVGQQLHLSLSLSIQIYREKEREIEKANQYYLIDFLIIIIIIILFLIAEYDIMSPLLLRHEY